MPFTQAIFVFFLPPGYAPRSWAEVLRTASTNFYALLGLLVLVIGVVLIIRARSWVKGAGAISVVAGAVLLTFVLHDIKAEIPSRRGVEQNNSISN
jgi:hypothetical protein